MTTVAGWTAPGFEGVRERFEKNFAEGLEIGAAFSAYHRGEKVVDLWGGVADRDTGAPWEEDTLALVFSTTKGVTAICANRLAQEGRLDIDAPVVEYWPEFGQAGKEQIPVDHLLTHRAGLPWVDERLTLDQALSWEPMIHALEHQAPVWEPGTKFGYHAVTYGYLVGEVIRRITDRSIGAYFRELAGDPLDLDLWIGLPEEHESRVCTLVGALIGNLAPADGEGDLSEGPPADLDAASAALFGRESMLWKALTAGRIFEGRGIFNSRAVHAAEIPAANGIGDARSLARLYAATIGEVDGIRLLGPEQLETATKCRTSGPNVVLLDLDIQFGLGFIVPSSLVTLGGPRSFGHFGAGGSAGWADPEAEMAFGYVMNRMDMGLAGDTRSYGLVGACYDAIA